MDYEESLHDWVVSPVKKLKTFDVPTVTSGIKIKQSGNITGRIFKDAIGYMFFKSNNVDTSAQQVALFTTAYSNGMGFGINKDNFERAIVSFSARKLIISDWINSKDEFLVPNIEHPDYEEFLNDSIIYDLFHIHNNCSSLRNVEYKDKSWEIKNEFFWMSTQEIMDLADENDNEACYEDAATSKERFVYKYLQNIVLTPEAQAVLDMANDLVRNSFNFREQFNSDNPEYQINNWDCGYYQLKKLWSDYMPDEFRDFRLKYNKLADKMRPMVYELGFLKK